MKQRAADFISAIWRGVGAHIDRIKAQVDESGGWSSSKYVKIAAVVVVILIVLFAASLFDSSSRESLGQKWRSLETRRPGDRQTLTIGDEEYGLVWIPAGEFEMGSSESERDEASANARKHGFDWSYDEESRRHVEITKGFWELETEVTQALYKEIMETNPSNFEGDDLPVEQVSWDDATKFCKMLTKRLPKGVTATLPTEAQWEYSCRAGTKSPYSFGAVLNGDKANCNGEIPYGTSKKGARLSKTAPVKSYAANPWGLYDMHGNVREWTADYYAEAYPAEPETDPKGPDGGAERAIRGGGWGNDARNCRSACRNGLAPEFSTSFIGFRFILIYEEPSKRAGKPTSARRPVETDVSSWFDSATREAGTRRTLTIGDAEYGFRWIPAGEFEMGSPESESGRFHDEARRHVKLTKGFWTLETETTQALYKEVMGTNPSNFKGDNLPVEEVSWDDAMKFCEELTKRLPEELTASLPTEAQWEYACRAGTTTPYSFGTVLNGDKANCDGDYPYGTTTKGKRVRKTTLAKSYDANRWGLYDMHGNVWEWTLDYYDEDYPPGPLVDPKGPDDGSFRVYRGGAWSVAADACRSAHRNQGAPDRRGPQGFRFLLTCDRSRAAASA